LQQSNQTTHQDVNASNTKMGQVAPQKVDGKGKGF